MTVQALKKKRRHPKHPKNSQPKPAIQEPETKIAVPDLTDESIYEEAVDSKPNVSIEDSGPSVNRNFNTNVETPHDSREDYQPDKRPDP